MRWKTPIQILTVDLSLMHNVKPVILLLLQKMNIQVIKKY